jgi:hypothetical protein
MRFKPLWIPFLFAFLASLLLVWFGPQRQEVANGRTQVTTRRTLSESYGKLPLSFELNQGQTNGRVKFLSRGHGYSLFLTRGEVVLALQGPAAASDSTTGHSAAGVRRTLLRLKLVGANPEAKIEGLGELPGKSNYFIGNDASKWRTNVPNYAKVRFENIYPGVDVVYYGNQKNLEHDFIVAPGVDPSAITLAVKAETGTSQKHPLVINSRGDLVVRAGHEEFRFQRPLIYQETNVGRQEVAGGYIFKADNEVGFDIRAYDQTKPLVIDPVLVYSTYLGGSADEVGFTITVNSAGNAYVAGATTSADFPLTPGAFQTSFEGPNSPQRGDAYVTELNPAGTGIVFSTYLGGSGNENGRAIALDSAGNVYLAGDTGSSNFPTLNPAQPSFAGGEADGFVAKLNATGSSLIYSTYLGGSGGSSFGDGVSAIVADTSGNAYVTGGTDSTNFPTVNALQPTHGGGTFDAFIAKFGPTGSLVFSTFLGGNGIDVGEGIALDASGNICVGGLAESTNFPTLNPLQASNAGGRDGFVAKLNAAGSALIFSSYLGGAATDEVDGLAVDAADNIYVTGLTASTNFPTANPLQASNAGDFDGYVTKLNAAGSALVYSTYLGGSGFEEPTGIAVDSSGNAYVIGETQSSNFPVTPGAPQSSFGGVRDAFVTKMNAVGSALVYSTYLGGSGSDGTGYIALDAFNNAYVTGTTSSSDFPTTPGAFQVMIGGGNDAFVTKLADCPIPPTFSVSLSPNVLWPPNNKLVAIAANITVSDFCDAHPSVVLVSITANEPLDGDDIQGATFGTDDRSFKLVAERDGGGSGRIYTVTYRATNLSGYATTASAQVTVPHDQGHH